MVIFKLSMIIYCLFVPPVAKNFQLERFNDFILKFSPGCFMYFHYHSKMYLLKDWFVFLMDWPSCNYEMTLFRSNDPPYPEINFVWHWHIILAFICSMFLCFFSSILLCSNSLHHCIYSALLVGDKWSLLFYVPWYITCNI